jgi:hypothetical protein
MQSFLDKSADAEKITGRIKKYLDAVRSGEAIDIKFDLLINPDKAKEELRRKADELFGFLERAAQREYKPKIVDAEKEVANAQNAVDEVQAKIDKIQNDIDKEQRDLEEGITRKIEVYQENVNDLQRMIEMKFDRDIEDNQKTISLLERGIDLDFDRPIEEIQKAIAELERGIDLDFDRPLSVLQETSSDLSNDLALIDKASESINEKYDAQADALQKVSDINQQILNQQKQQISLADALTQGDISAAAQMAQESRASSAEAYSTNAENTLQAARQLELDKLRNAAGLTRKQIEEAQFKIGQETFALEEKREAVQARIQIKQDEIFVIEKQREAVQARIQIIQDRIFVIERERELVLKQIRVIEDDIYDLEEDREAVMLIIRGYEDDIYNIKVKELEPAAKLLKIAQDDLQAVKDQLQARIDNVEKQKDAWEAAADAAIAAKVKAGEYNDVIEETIRLLGEMAAMLAAISDGSNIKSLVASGKNGLDSYVAPQDTEESILAFEEFLRIVEALDKAIADLEEAELGGDVDRIISASIALAAAQKAYDDYVNAGLTAQPDLEAVTAAADAAAKAAEDAAAMADATSEAADAASAAAMAALESGASSYVIDNLAKNAGIAAKAAADAAAALEAAADAAASAAAAAEAAAGAAASGSGGGGGMVSYMFASSGGMVPRYLASGGMVKPKYFSVGGSAKGTDTIPAMLTPGEFVMSKYAVSNYGVDKMKAMNTGTYEGEKVYNYNLSVNVKSDANPDDIARVVMTQIRQIDSQRIRTQRA